MDVRNRRPVSGQQLVEPTDPVIGDAVEDVSLICLWIGAVHLCRLDDRHSARQGFRAGIRPREEPVFSSDRHHPFILPMSGKLSSSIIAGMRFSVGN